MSEASDSSAKDDSDQLNGGEASRDCATRMETNDSVLDDAEGGSLSKLPTVVKDCHVLDGGTHSPIVAKVSPVKSLFEVVAAGPEGGRKAIWIERCVAPRTQPDDERGFTQEHVALCNRIRHAPVDEFQFPFTLARELGTFLALLMVVFSAARSQPC